MDKLRQYLSRNNSCDEDTSILTQINDATTLSWSTRIKWFCICFILGILLSFLSSLSIFFHKGAIAFAILYTHGNLISMASTFFLMGPKNQLKKMFATTRYIAAVLVFVTMVLTLIAALKFGRPGLTLLFIICQWCSLMWYSLSYIPYARDAVRKALVTIIV